MDQSSVINNNKNIQYLNSLIFNLEVITDVFCFFVYF